MENRELIRTGVGAVIFKDEQILLIKRGKMPFKDMWSIPGGALEYGETLHQAVIREVKEETNVEIEILSLLNIYELPAFPADGITPHHLMIDYVGEWKSGTPIAGDDASDACFVPVPKALEMISWDVTRTAVNDALALYETMRTDGKN